MNPLPPEQTKRGDLKGQRPASSRPSRAVVGLESEFKLFQNGTEVRPEAVFGSPRAIVRRTTIGRTGRSCHLPSGGALYFDTGVIEVATPIIELEAGCAIRSARSLFEQIEFLRDELDAWEREMDCEFRLQGFSTHYNISLPADRSFDEAQSLRLALLLTYILPLPVMLLASNCQSTGIGVRPRGDRLEVTADFTTDPELMIAAAAVIFGVVSAVSLWSDHSFEALTRRNLPVPDGFSPRRHTSRTGWLARFDCFLRNPFASDVNEPDWFFTDGSTRSLREAAHDIVRQFPMSIRRYADAEAFAHIHAVLDGRARSLLDFPERPWRYDNVGRRINWNRRRSRTLPRSAYERVIHRVISGEPLRIDGQLWLPEKMGWFEIVFRNITTRRKQSFNLDDLAARFQN